MQIIDPHLHLFNLRQGDYHWLQKTRAPFWPDKAIINKDFRENDLQLSDGLKLAGFIHIEAGFDNLKPWRELGWLEQHCHLPFKSIAFVALDDGQFSDKLMRLNDHRSMIGIRHILEDDAKKVLKQPTALAHLQQLAEHQLLFECQANLADHSIVEALLQLLIKTPDLQMIINHCGMPSSNHMSNSLIDNLTLLAQFTGVSIKCSGFEMRDRHWQWSELEDTLAILIDIFTIERVMLASNFPLTLFSRSYQALWQGYASLSYPSQQLDALCYDNAKRIYKL
ncbi:amidohydrolase [Thalassotalea maritima]|uniref:amidohydrolase family protein n=1 Tax=Thalassotalea maritima TaxID=3242416 RepID=UPI003527583B